VRFRLLYIHVTPLIFTRIQHLVSSCGSIERGWPRSISVLAAVVHNPACGENQTPLSKLLLDHSGNIHGGEFHHADSNLPLLIIEAWFCNTVRGEA
jgi:hypothetical protein